MTRRALSALLLAGSAACTVPTLGELEKERARACDDAHPCASGYVCVGGVCRQGSQPVAECTAGAREACGNDKGECTPGTRTCQQNGNWGSCIGEVGPVAEVCDGKDNDCDEQTDEDAVTAACGQNLGVCDGAKKACVAGVEEASCPASRYGADFQLGSEDRCDGKDNDCDGDVDESLIRGCGVDAGVCASAIQPCRDGGFGGCGAADFLANNPAYEVYESRCDGLDNDCDTRTDAWSSRVISDAGTRADGGVLARRGVVAVAIPDAGSAAQRDVLAFYEEGPRVVMRQLRADGTIGAPTHPVPTNTVRDYAPALASDGTTMVAAWFNEIVAGPSVLHRLSIGLPRPDGVSIINGAVAASSINLTGPGASVSVAVGGGRVALAWQWDDVGSSRVSLGNCPISFTTACAVTTLTATNVRRPRIAIHPSGTSQYVVYENAANSRVLLVSADYTAPGNVPTLTQSAAISLSQADNERDGWVFLDSNTQLRFYFTNAQGTAVKSRTCSIPCTSPDNGSTTVTQTLPVPGTGVTVTRAGTVTLAALSASPSILYEELVPGATGASGIVNVGHDALRGWPVITSTGAAASFTILYDTEGSTTGVADVVMARRFCGP